MGVAARILIDARAPSVFVGDSLQRVNAWRYAVNTLKKVPEHKRFELTGSVESPPQRSITPRHPDLEPVMINREGSIERIVVDVIDDDMDRCPGCRWVECPDCGACGCDYVEL